MENIIVIDTETTGTDTGSSELLQVSIISGSGNVLFNHYIKPTHTTSWPGAQRVNHISPAKVKHCRTIDFFVPKLQKIIDNADIIVGYNLKSFDIPILERAGLYFRGEIVDVYLENRDDESLPTHKLVDVAKNFGYTFNPHDSLEDCRATLHIYNKTHSGKEKKTGAMKNTETVFSTKDTVSAAKHNQIGRIFGMLRMILVIVLGVFLNGVICDYIQPHFAEDIRLYVSMTVAGLYCYLTEGLTGPITGVLGYFISGVHPLWTRENIMVSISIIVSALALRILFKYTKRYKSIIFRFIMCALAIVAASFVFYLSSGYINGVISGVPFMIHRIERSDPASIVFLCLLASLPLDMLLSRILRM